MTLIESTAIQVNLLFRKMAESTSRIKKRRYINQCKTEIRTALKDGANPSELIELIDEIDRRDKWIID